MTNHRSRMYISASKGLALLLSSIANAYNCVCVYRINSKKLSKDCKFNVKEIYK